MFSIGVRVWGVVFWMMFDMFRVVGWCECDEWND